MDSHEKGGRASVSAGFAGHWPDLCVRSFSWESKDVM